MGNHRVDLDDTNITLIKARNRWPLGSSLPEVNPFRERALLGD